MSKPSPFPPSTSIPGTGSVHLTLDPQSHPIFSSLFFTYPLKLVVSAAHPLPPPSSPSSSPPHHPSSVPLLFLLSYGGGLVSKDHISLSITLSPSTRLTLATQGSTKIFKPPPSSSAPTLPPPPPPLTRQDLHVAIGAHAALWLAPDPCQPFAQSRYAQRQTFDIDVSGHGSLGLVDWVCEGRSARGEKWACESWRGKNEVWDISSSSSSSSAAAAGEKEEIKKKKGRKLILRDNIILSTPNLPSRLDHLGIFGTLILLGPLFSPLAAFFVAEFKALPRIGARDWSSSSSGHKTSPSEKTTDGVKAETEEERWRRERQAREKRDGVLWTAASVRGAVVVKFGAREVEGAKVWLGEMLRWEGTVGREFGVGGLMCTK
ncbi:MAG: hypothetical protein Q9219_007230 [cf. Caloplaca sp. 3 TL-2023]